MTHIDFIMAFALMIGVISFSIFYVTDNFTTQFNTVTITETRAYANVIENKLFKDLLKEDKSLVKSRFEEIGGKTHTEMLLVKLPLNVKNPVVQVYDTEMNLIPSLFVRDQLSFSLTMSPNEKKYVNIFYTGKAGKISYGSDPKIVNITARILSEQTFSVISETKCKNLDYNTTGFEKNFKLKLGTCEIGLDPPQDTVVAKSVPVMLSSNILTYEMARIMVW